MSTLLSEGAAATLIAVDETGNATLTEIATAIGRPISTVQRATESLVRSHALRRIGPRGRFAFAPDAPRKVLRDLAEWRLGQTRAAEVSAAAQYVLAGGRVIPRSVKRPEVRRSLPVAVNRIVDRYHPDRVILFGSQARGDADQGSDVDLLVIFSDEGDRRERQVTIMRLLADMPFAKDVLVASNERARDPLPGTAVKSALGEGVTLYER
jgi:predicted nucleotidyltransferase